MNISQVAKQTGLSAKSIRFYEEKELITAPMRGDNGYRYYAEKHLEQLNLIARAKLVGFSLEECKSLVQLANNPCRSSADVKKTAQQKLIEVDEKLKELQVIRGQLQSWIERCPGNEAAACPIIDELTGQG